MAMSVRLFASDMHPWRWTRKAAAYIVPLESLSVELDKGA